MKVMITLLLVLGTVTCQTVEYSPLIYGMLEGARLVDKVSVSKCHNPASRERRTVNFENLLQDAATLAQGCKWTSAVKVLQEFRTHRPLVSKAAEELTSFLLAVLDRPQRAMRNDGVSMGQILESKIVLMSPYVLKFKFDGEVLLNHSEKATPIAVLHGLGDCCCFSGMTEFTRYLGLEANTVARCLEVGDGPTASWLMGFKLQVDTACANLRKVPEFANGVSLVGLSQGGLLARALAQYCDVPIRTVVSIGGPQMGLASTPKCVTGYYCDIYQDAVDLGVFHKVPQNHIGPPGYFKDAVNFETYVEKSGFLAVFNNERSANASLVERLGLVEKLVLVMFGKDSVSDPKISQHFGYYANGSKGLILGMNKTNDYVNDLIGLKSLDSRGKVVLETVDADHLVLSSYDIQTKVLPYLF